MILISDVRYTRDAASPTEAVQACRVIADSRDSFNFVAEFIEDELSSYCYVEISKIQRENCDNINGGLYQL